MTSMYVCLSIMWLAVGALWLRRAYMGEKRLLVVTLTQPHAERESRRTRLTHGFMGMAYLGLGIWGLIALALKASHHLR